MKRCYNSDSNTLTFGKLDVKRFHIQIKDTDRCKLSNSLSVDMSEVGINCGMDGHAISSLKVDCQIWLLHNRFIDNRASHAHPRTSQIWQERRTVVHSRWSGCERHTTEERLVSLYLINVLNVSIWSAVIFQCSYVMHMQELVLHELKKGACMSWDLYRQYAGLSETHDVLHNHDICST